MSKKQIGKLVDACFHLVGNTKTAELLDKIKAIGYHYARQAGMSIAISDIQIPAENGISSMKPTRKSRMPMPCTSAV